LSEGELAFGDVQAGHPPGDGSKKTGQFSEAVEEDKKQLVDRLEREGG
jgi:hypothetical protein